MTGQAILCESWFNIEVRVKLKSGSESLFGKRGRANGYRYIAQIPGNSKGKQTFLSFYLFMVNIYFNDFLQIRLRTQIPMSTNVYVTFFRDFKYT